MDIKFIAYRTSNTCDRCGKNKEVLVQLDVDYSNVPPIDFCEECIDAAKNLFQEMRDNPEDTTIESISVNRKKN